MNQQFVQNPLLGKFDKDPGRWRSYKYGVTLDVPVVANGEVEGSIVLNNQPFIIDRLTHSVVGDTHDPLTSGLADDGQYFIDWRDQISQYQNTPLLAKAAYGTEHFPIPLSVPLAYAGNVVLTFRVRNAYTRILTPEADTFQVQIAIHGVADWGTDRRP